MDNLHHHIWCNFSNENPATCKMCERLKKDYPEDVPPDELIKKHFPNAIVRT